MKPFLIRHLTEFVSKSSPTRFPVWMMRQAGRFLPEYREIRKQHSFWDSVKNPSISSQITLLPVDILDVDAAIYFSDILTLPYSVGIPIELVESVGPCLKERLQDLKSFECFHSYEPSKHTPFVSETLTDIRKKLHPDKALIGFAGAPWTVASYLIEGKSSKDFSHLKTWMFKDAQELALAFSSLGKATEKYLLQQIQAGADIVQLFDTWVSEMPYLYFEKYYAPILERIFRRVKETGTRVIYFPKKAQHLYPLLTSLSFDVLSVDSSISLSLAEQLTQGKFSLQGNLDPLILLMEPQRIAEETLALIEEATTLKRPAVLNLGHGVLKNTPVENAKVFIDGIKQYGP